MALTKAANQSAHSATRERGMIGPIKRTPHGQNTYVNLVRAKSGSARSTTSRQEQPEAFDAQCSRYRRSLYFIACRLLGVPEWAEDAVTNCFHAASRNPPRFDCEGDFRLWLMRILIDEALFVLHEERNK